MEVFAHRAGSGVSIGNTVEAILYCLKMGFNFEIDVRQCADGWVITHRDKLGNDNIIQYPTSAVRKFGINRNDGSVIYAPATVHGRSDVHRIPTLAEVLRLVSESGKDVKIILDIKGDLGLFPGRTLGSVIKLIESYALEKQIIIGLSNQAEAREDAFLYIKEQLNSKVSTLLFRDWAYITSLPIALKKSAMHFPETTTVLNNSVDHVRLWQNWLRNEYGETTDPSGLINKMHDIDKKVIVTAGGMNEIDGGEISPGQLKRLTKLGVDGVIVNDPAIYL